MVKVQELKEKVQIESPICHSFPPLSFSYIDALVSFLLVSQQKAKNEELIHLAEQKKKEAERKKKEAEEKENAVLRRQYERERQPREEEVCSLTAQQLIFKIQKFIESLHNNFHCFPDLHISC